jgi:hypothetical protein
MTAWNWLIKYEGYSWRFILRVLIKATILFVLFNVLFAILQPMEALGAMSLRSQRQRLPYGEDDNAYNLSINNLPAMFASHEISQAKAQDEFRVFLLGDSQNWGRLLRPEETLSAVINAENYTLDDGRHIRAYNLSYPSMSATKDLLLLDYAMQYEPDMVVWLTSLQTFVRKDQVDESIISNNAQRLKNLISTYSLDLDISHKKFDAPTFWDRTIIRQRRELSDWLRLQLFSVMWTTTGIDQYYEDYNPLSNDLKNDISWRKIKTPIELTTEGLAFDVLMAGIKMANDIPVLLVNTPIFIGDGENSDLRYSTKYPRWAYDQYRVLYHEQVEDNQWNSLDVWDILDWQEFSNSASHIKPIGAKKLGDRVGLAIVELATQ